MSLVNDALRKARREAAERDAEERGSTYRPPRAHLPPEPRSGLLVGLVVGLLVAFVGTGVGWHLATRDQPETATVTADATHTDIVNADTVKADGTDGEQLRGLIGLFETPPAEDSDDAPTLDPPAAEEPEPEASASTRVSPADTEPESVSEPPASPPQQAPAVEAETPPATAVTAVTAVTEAEPPPASPPPPAATTTTPPAPSRPDERARVIREPARTGRVEPDVYVLEADLDDTVLHLDFIIFSPTAPFAQINGAQVSPGQIVDGWSVVAVEREQVQLRRGERDVVLRVR